MNRAMNDPARQEEPVIVATPPASSATDDPPKHRPNPVAVISKSTVIGWLIGLGAIFAIAVSLHYEPPRGIRVPGFAKPLPEICNARRMFGFDCPGCGLTRSFVLSAKQQWGTAFRIHPFGTLGFAFLMALVPYRLWQGWRLHKGHAPRSTLAIELSVLAALGGGSMVWWIARLISGAAIG